MASNNHKSIVISDEKKLNETEKTTNRQTEMTLRHLMYDFVNLSQQYIENKICSAFHKPLAGATYFKDSQRVDFAKLF